MTNMQLRMRAAMERERLLSLLNTATWRMLTEKLTVDEFVVKYPSPDGVSEPRWKAMLVTYINNNGELG